MGTSRLLTEGPDQADGLASGLVSGDVTGATLGAADPLELLQAPTNSAAARINRARTDFMGGVLLGFGETPP